MSAQVSVLLQFKVPFNMVERLKAVLDNLQRIHNREVELLEKRLRTSPNDEGAAHLNALRERGRRLNLHGLARLAIAQGLGALADERQTLEYIAQDAVTKGRPRT